MKVWNLQVALNWVLVLMMFSLVLITIWGNYIALYGKLGVTLCIIFAINALIMLARDF